MHGGISVMCAMSIKGSAYSAHSGCPRAQVRSVHGRITPDVPELAAGRQGAVVWYYRQVSVCEAVGRLYQYHDGIIGTARNPMEATGWSY